MNNREKFISELHLILKIVEKNIPTKSSQVLMIREGLVKKPQAKGKDKSNGKGKGKGKGKGFVPKSRPIKKEKLAKDVVCFHYGEVGHWRRNCPVYLAELKKEKADHASASGTKKK